MSGGLKQRPATIQFLIQAAFACNNVRYMFSGHPLSAGGVDKPATKAILKLSIGRNQ
jgi:hypothetical protein